MSEPAVRRRGPGSRADERHPTRHLLLDAAERIAGRDGLDALSVGEITGEAGLAKGTFYVHFPDRGTVLVELHRRFHDRVFERVAAASAQCRPGPERARRRMLAFLDCSRQEHSVRAMLLQARTEPAVLFEVRRRNDAAARLLATDLRGLVAHPLETARMLVAATAEAALLEFDAGRQLPRVRAALGALVPDPPAR